MDIKRKKLPLQPFVEQIDLVTKYCGVILKGYLRRHLGSGNCLETVVLTEPFASRYEAIMPDVTFIYDDRSSYTDALIYIYKREQQRVAEQQFIADNRAALQQTILPLWFKREAFVAANRASVEDSRKRARRDVRCGKCDKTTYNNYISILRTDSDEDFADWLRIYNREIYEALESLGVKHRFHLSLAAAERLFGRSIWEDMLQVRTISGDERKRNIVKLTHCLNNFNALYDTAVERLSCDAVLERYDTIVLAGFDSITLAAAFYNNGELCAVMALDTAQGRRALRHLVPSESLAALLPKRVYNAVTRDEFFAFDGVEYLPKGERDIVVVQ